jgi:hypothetical protein
VMIQARIKELKKKFLKKLKVSRIYSVSATFYFLSMTQE